MLSFTYSFPLCVKTILKAWSLASWNQWANFQWFQWVLDKIPNIYYFSPRSIGNMGFCCGGGFSVQHHFKKLGLNFEISIIRLKSFQSLILNCFLCNYMWPFCLMAVSLTWEESLQFISYSVMNSAGTCGEFENMKHEAVLFSLFCFVF